METEIKLTTDKKNIIAFIINELSKRGLIKQNEDITQKTKELLKNFQKLKKSITNYEKEIKNLDKAKNKIDGPKFKASSLGSSKAYSDVSSLDIIDSRIRDLQLTIVKVQCFIKEIDDIISTLDKEDSDLIDKIYFQKINADDIAIELGCDASTIYRRISRIIDKIKVELFANDFIDNMLY